MKIFNENNLDLMARYKDNYFDLAVVDIPYGIDVGNMAFVKERKTKVLQKNGKRINARKNTKIKTTDWDLKTPDVHFWNELKRISKNQILFGVEYVNWDFGEGRIKWNKGVAKGMSFKGYEMAYCSFIDYIHQIDYLWSGMMQGKSLKEPLVMQGNKKLNEKRMHPTQKPVLLYDLIFLFCIEQGIKIDRVIDTNIGLASIAISSYKFEEIKEFVGCEINSIYYKNAIERTLKYKSQLNCFINYEK